LEIDREAQMVKNWCPRCQILKYWRPTVSCGLQSRAPGQSAGELRFVKSEASEVSCGLCSPRRQRCEGPRTTADRKHKCNEFSLRPVQRKTPGVSRKGPLCFLVPTAGFSPVPTAHPNKFTQWQSRPPRLPPSCRSCSCSGIDGPQTKNAPSSS